MAGNGSRIGVTELLVGVPFPPAAIEIMRCATAPQFFAEAIFGGATYSPIEAVGRCWVHDLVESEALLDRALDAASALAALPAKASWWGLPVIAVALATLVVGTVGAELFLSRVSLLFVIAGIVVLFWGWTHFRAVLFPWLFLFLMIPIPAIIFNQITFPLQILASKVAAWVLPVAGVPVLREGNVINLAAMPLEVAQACSGIRSLLSLTTLAIMYGYLMEPRKVIRVVLALASIPIAVAANSLRIVGTGLLVHYWDPDKAEGFFHAFSGWLIFVVSLLMLFLLHRLTLLKRDRLEEQR